MDARPTCQNQPQKLQRQERRSKQQKSGQYGVGTAAAQLGAKFPRVVYQLTRSAGLSLSASWRCVQPLARRSAPMNLPIFVASMSKTSFLFCAHYKENALILATYAP